MIHDRLMEIEKKLDRVTEILSKLAVVDERISNLVVDSSRVTGRISDLESKAHKLSSEVVKQSVIITRLERLAWILGAAVTSAWGKLILGQS